MMIRRIAFIGLGVMGYPMAAWLSRNNYAVTVYNRTASVAERWLQQHSGTRATSPQQAARDAQMVFTCVGNDDDLRDVVLGEQGALSGMCKGAVLVDHSTVSAEVSRQVNEYCQSVGCGFIDAPVSGGQQGAENGQLTVMCGGDPILFDKVVPVLESYSRAVTLLGPCGSGQLCKMVNQICIAGLIQSLAEGLNFAQNAGLDAAQVVSVISQGAAQSWQMENRYNTMLQSEYNHGFAVDWMRKDLAIAMAEAERNGSALPIARIVDQYYAEVQQMGGGRWDTSSLLARLRSDDQSDSNAAKD